MIKSSVWSKTTIFFLTFFIVPAFLAMGLVRVGEANAAWQAEWEKTVQAAKKEGKIVAAIPASAELRKRIVPAFNARFPDIEMELTPGRGSQNARKIMAEYKAGVRNFDLFISGPSSSFGMMRDGMVDPVEPYFIDPKVKDPKNWYGGYMWNDTAQRYIYVFQAYQADLTWYNTDLVKPGEMASYDDWLNPKWKGKIGYLDPRTPGAGTALWAFLWKMKGKGYLQKLAQQDLVLSRNQRQLADNVAKGTLAMVIGITYYSMRAHLEAGLPVKPLPDPKEGSFTTNGSGALTILKDPPHPNATRVFVNWFLSKEGQEVYGKAMGQGTRRLDVDTKWLAKLGSRASKDFLTVKEHYRLENYTEATINDIWRKSVKFAREIFK